MNMQQVLIDLEATLPTEFKEVIIAQFNSMYGTNIIAITEDERIFSAIYSVLIGTLAHVGQELVEIAESDDEEIEDIPLEEVASFKMCSSYAAHTLKTVMELAEVSTVMKAINGKN